MSSILTHPIPINRASRRRVAEARSPFGPNDLALFVWPTRGSVDAPASLLGSQELAAHSSWAMEKSKADRVRILVSVEDDTIAGVWTVRSSASTLSKPEGKSRRVNRATFATADDARLHYLIGQPSQIARRRNPQTTIEIRDLLGSDVLLGAPEVTPNHGVVRIGDFTLTVREDGSADLVYPARSPVTLRPEGS